MLRHYFNKWLTTAYFRSTLARPLHDFVCRQRASSTTAALLRQWSASTRADPRAILDDWPDGDEFDSIISVSGEHCLATHKTMADGRCMKMYKFALNLVAEFNLPLQSSDN